MSKAQMLNDGACLVRRFCLWNDLEQPRIDIVSKADWRFPSTCAYYRQNVITICPDRCANVGKAGRAWSYPGYAIDRTPFGVMAHELGHHVDRLRSTVQGAYGGSFSVGLRQLSGEPKLTGYCPNDWEWFAEMFRLFATNSDLLAAIRPKTHALILEAGLRPVQKRPWKEVLKDAPERTLAMAERKANG